jgi:lysophospholipase L1-like esterase
MKFLSYLTFICTFSFLSFNIFSQNTIWIIGDSTVSSFNDDYYYPRYGWGTQMQNFIDVNKYEVKNIALSGRSSKSYVLEKEYKYFIENMKKGDYLFLGFGHNDEKYEKERYTNPNGDYKALGSLANSLYENYISKANLKGVSTILYTPIVRRTSDNWTDEELHITKNSGEFEGGDYRKSILDLGKTLNIPVIDLTSLTKNLYDNLGVNETKYLHAWTSSNPSSIDNTHTNIWGANYNAYFMAKELYNMNLENISKAILLNKIDKSPSKNEILITNPNYVEKTYNNIQKNSEYWEDFSIFKGTVFGDTGGTIDKNSFYLGKNSEGNMNIKVIGNKGKIANSVDGIAMYYYKIPAGSTFTLKALMTINDFAVNNQVSFGLMARDEIYIDEYITSPIGDYVAIAPLKLTQVGNIWNSFARKNGTLSEGGIMKNSHSKGDIIPLTLSGTSDGYSGKFGDEEPISGGFDFPLTKIDSDYIYIGMFASRNADVTFSDITLIVNGKEVVLNK